MLLGLHTFSYHLAFRWGEMDLVGFIHRAAELGLDGVQLHWRHFREEDFRRLPELRRLIDDLGLYVEIDTPFFERGHLREMLRVCAELGATHLRTYISTPELIDGAAQRDYVRDELPQQLAAAPSVLRDMVPLCAELGVRIGIENHEYETSADLLRVVAAVDSEWIGILLDNGNSMMVWEEPLAAARAMAPRAVSTHFKDHLVIVEGGEPVVVGVPLGRGRIDLAESFRIHAAAPLLERLNIEVCYAYRAPFRRPPPGSGPPPQKGVFLPHPPPWDPAVVAPFPLPEDPAGRRRLIDWQAQAVVDSVACVSDLNRRWG
ncbi:MAG: hypothetical protein CMJ18_06730 [Phycisphaeraceae bacterium]|nr:hypothetical protein [Phycisphaeraceae bacterium]